MAWRATSIFLTAHKVLVLAHTVQPFYRTAQPDVRGGAELRWALSLELPGEALLDRYAYTAVSLYICDCVGCENPTVKILLRNGLQFQRAICDS